MTNQIDENKRLITSYQPSEEVDNTFINLILSNLIHQFTISMVEIYIAHMHNKCTRGNDKHGVLYWGFVTIVQ